jgi:hypothetical protein
MFSLRRRCRGWSATVGLTPVTTIFIAFQELYKRHSNKCCIFIIYMNYTTYFDPHNSTIASVFLKLRKVLVVSAEFFVYCSLPESFLANFVLVVFDDQFS